ncbi:hypothetical protein EVAR_38140_1 [Eumeta japonica]|uniref:Uncharacterized protein n=1 Tax=Eumeta variegata TaxID=151549 RepID=A0A4C1YQY3_EUMVA|nr:hypothetical protein EVAR_38140_1 [Eumeta japonica]
MDGITEEDFFLAVITMKGQTRGCNFMNALREFIGKYCVPASKMISVYTDGCPSMWDDHCSTATAEEVLYTKVPYQQIWTSLGIGGDCDPKVSSAGSEPAERVSLLNYNSCADVTNERDALQRDPSLRLADPAFEYACVTQPRLARLSSSRREAARHFARSPDRCTLPAGHQNKRDRPRIGLLPRGGLRSIPRSYLKEELKMVPTENLKS